MVKDNIAEEVATLKQESGKDAVIYGSASIVQTLTNLDLLQGSLYFITSLQRNNEEHYQVG